MTRDEWQRVKQVAAEALDVEPSDRSAYVVAACRGDVDLEREVASLLASAESADQLFEGPLSLPAAATLQGGRLALERNDYDAALREFTEAAQGGNADAQYELFQRLRKHLKKIIWR